MSRENEGVGQKRRKRSMVELYDIADTVNLATQAKWVFLYRWLEESNWYSFIEVACGARCSIN